MTNREKIKICIQRADDSLLASELSRDNELAIAAINRAYYAVFYSITALLISKEIYPKTHSGLMNQFGQHFIKTGVFATKLNAKVSKIFEFRNEADYDLEAFIEEKEIEEALEIAKEVILLTKEYLKV